MSRRLLLLAGAGATAVYVFTVILGGIMRPGYSHLSQAVSELIEVGAPNKNLLNPLFLLYNVLTAAFAVGLFFSAEGKRGWEMLVGASVVLAAEAVFGFVTVFVPQDVPGTAVTPSGSVHIVLAGLSSLTTMLAILLMALWFHRVRALPGYGAYSLITLIVVFVTGGIAALTTAKGVPINGLFERITIGGFLQWMFVLGVTLCSHVKAA